MQKDRCSFNHLHVILTYSSLRVCLGHAFLLTQLWEMEMFWRISEVDCAVRVGRQLERASSNQLTELETDCVIQPSLLCLRLRVSLATHIFGKPRWSTRPRPSGRARAASNPCASPAAAAECNIMICGRLPAQSRGWPSKRHLAWFKAGSVSVCVWVCLQWPLQQMIRHDDEHGHDRALLKLTADPSWPGLYDASGLD